MKRTIEKDARLLQVARPLDTLPWVRGWGAAVEVLTPSRLRETLADEAVRLGIMYGARA